MRIVALRMQWPPPTRFVKVAKTAGKAQALVSFGTRGVFGCFANRIDQAVQ